MDGLIIPNYTRSVYSAMMGELNGDKNYLSLAELAAIADNCLAFPTVEGLTDILSPYNLAAVAETVYDEVLAKAVRLSLLVREGNF